jgi:uncharacterized protein YrrD
MLLSTEILRDLELAATDGNVGTVEDVYFDDHRWVVRYLVVETGGWLSGRKVLISPHAVHDIDPARSVVRTELTRERVEKSPPIDADRPVSRQHEIEFAQYYGSPAYWSTPALLGAEMGILPAPLEPPVPSSRQEQGDPHLRSCNEVTGYAVAARDGDIGHVEQLLFDSENWAIRYLVIDTGKWWPGRKVLISPRWVDWFDWSREKVLLTNSRTEVEASPEYDPAEPTGRAYEEALHGHYRKPTYWTTRDEPVTPSRGNENGSA